MARGEEASVVPAYPPLAARLLVWSAAALVAVAWFSAAFFGTYIVFYYAGAIAAGSPEQWNDTLPGLFSPRAPAATAGIAMHFVAGGIILLLGPIQLIGRVRAAAPAAHRWIGRTYVAAAFLAGLGGLAFILVNGTIGGPAMALGFGLYGALMVVASVQTYRHARARPQHGRLALHRAWAIRLFALAIGSWLYRMDYGFWFLVADGAGHTSAYRGWFDYLMDVFFYLPNLAVAEAFIRARGATNRPALQTGAALLLAATAGVVALATWQFAKIYWIPGIALRLAAA
jgi:hypothetical protein